MTVTHRAVFDRLAASTDPRGAETTTAAALAVALDAHEGTVDAHLASLEGCKLARREANGRVRDTITGAELAALEAEETVVLAAPTGDTES